MFHSSFFHSLFFLFAYLCIPLELVYIMLKLTTSVERPAHCPCIDYRHTLLLLGSCFATHIGERLEEAKFRCDVNPYGVLYNPLSIATALREMVARKVYTEADLYEHQGLWHSPMHHGDFSAPTHGEALARINGRLAQASDELDRLDFLLLTWGTAWVYEDRKTGRVAGNCHKLPESCFRRRRLSVDEIVADTVSLLSGLVARSNGRLRVVLTISPIRHVRDGLHANQLSKATLLLERLAKRRDAGLTTPKQIRCLENYGFRHVGNWPFEAAKHMIDRIAAGGWRGAPAGVDPASYAP